MSAIDISTPLTVDTANQNGKITLYDNFIMGFFSPHYKNKISKRKKINKLTEGESYYSVKNQSGAKLNMRLRKGKKKGATLVFTVCMAMCIEALLTTLPMSVMADSR